MSGIEVVGLVLGVLPLVISAAEDYKKGFEPLLRWKRFKFGFRDFITSVDIQRQMFQLVLKKLLIRVQLPAEEKQKLLTVPNYEGWTQPGTIDAIKLRLGDSFEACRDILRAMRDDMEDLQKMMSLKDGSVHWAHPGEKQWKYQAKRIQLSFSENGTRTVQSLEKRIQDLRCLLDLLDSTEDEDSYNTQAISKDTTWAKLFECVRRHATNLHWAIKNGWKCNCEGIHAAGLQLRKRTADDWSSQFTMTFGALPLRKHAETNLYTHRKVFIVLKESTDSSALMPSRPKPSPIQGSYLNQLRTDFELRSSSEMTSATISGHSSANSSISSRFSSFGSIFSKSDSNLATSTLSTCSGTEILLESAHSKKVTNLKPQVKVKKGISFAADLPTKHEENSQIQSTTPNLKPPAPPKISLPADQSSTDVEISDLCSVLKGLDPSAKSLGYLSDRKNRRHELCCLTQEVPDPEIFDLVGLEKLLAVEGKLRLTRQKRYKVACILASSLLQLQTTPWLSGNLNKQSILFYYQENEVLADQPYISHSFPSTKSCHGSTGTTSENEKNLSSPRVALSSLGILLLELCWGQSIEDQTNLRKRHLSSDGKAIEGTDYLTAIDWLDTVDEEEPKMVPIIKWCIFCLYSGKPNWTDTKFTQAVYVNVVRPLELLVAPT
ncbi:hypothetical protein G7Y89_g6550 [Cudoniella acicularis]|uniref:DUF7580 domain-containing protein n=1 Tax=Cudoniella acicularis TaxID=354080 RepID=A0A8H4W5D9_9HELO|nr:hypothetical protein G7Y89_g6550 [Cudoniella acicularis]